MSVGIRIPLLQIRVAAAAFILLTVAICLGGCAMKREPVSEKDIEIARQMDAPDEIMTSLEARRWPSGLVYDKVKNAEACIDYLSDKYS